MNLSQWYYGLYVAAVERGKYQEFRHWALAFHGLEGKSGCNPRY